MSDIENLAAWINNNLDKLLECGFERKESEEALMKNNNDIN